VDSLFLLWLGHFFLQQVTMECIVCDDANLEAIDTSMLSASSAMMPLHNMPGMDGYEVTDRWLLGSFRFFRQLPDKFPIPDI
jgi:hypothetical protein